MNATDPTAALVGSLISLLLSAAVYVWIALALSAVFRKSGVESWKAWVPILNAVVLLQLAGLSGWWLLLIFFPVLGAIALVVVFVFAVYRVSVAFGFGVGMTVLGVLVFPVWASVIGWGSARWVGRELVPSPSSRGASGRAADETAGLPPLPPFPTPVSRSGAPAAFPAPGAADPALSGFAPPPAYTPPAAPAPAAAVPVAPETPPAPVAAAPAEAAPASAVPAETPAAAAAPVVVPPPGGWTPPPLPGRPVSAAAAEAALDGEPVRAASPAPAGDTDPWQGFGLDTTDRSAEVTGAFPGAPAPISAVPAAGPESIPAVPAAYDVPEVYAPKPSSPITPGEGITRPPVTDVPLPAITGEDREPWAPAHSPMAEADAFPEASGPVSAVAGVAGAGIPFSARSSVSAQHSRPEIPDEDPEVFDETVIARRKRTEWTLLPPTGDPVALTSDVVILGRRPSADAAFPTAQLVPIQDGTVSKTHARLQLREDRWYVVDLDSTNGVLFATVLGTEVEATPGVEVEAGDRFLLGDAEVRLQRSDG
ncbi:DUF5684 domain-containing protein [Microbacterium sp. NPDC058389]|uniref:DUF5684 domain-containing protein n=1 Tax=Microbacterium sp. NPDC058389 TaxID=3346475 RepID=UPI003653BAA2